MSERPFEMLNRAKPFGTGNIYGLCTAQQTGAGAFLGGTFRGPRFDVIESGPIEKIQFLFTNYGSNDTGGPAPLTIGCSIEVGTTAAGNQTTDAKYPLTFNGKLTAIIDPLGCIWSDPINLDISAGAFIWPRTYITVPTDGLGFPYTFPGSANYGEGGDWDGITPVDNRNSGTITIRGDTALYGPSAAIGVCRGQRLDVIGVVGDSISTGTGDSGTVYSEYRLGWVTRGIAGRLPMLQPCRGSETTFTTRTRRFLQIDTCDHVIAATGVNDLSGTAAALQIAYVARWRTLAAMGPKIWQATITPVSTSSDSWATTGNQTTSANNSKRTTVNDWLRDGAPLDPAALTPVVTGTNPAVRAGVKLHPLQGYIEVADLVESARNSGIWKAAHTADGTHPNSTGHIAMSAALTTLPF